MNATNYNIPTIISPPIYVNDSPYSPLENQFPLQNGYTYGGATYTYNKSRIPLYSNGNVIQTIYVSELRNHENNFTANSKGNFSYSQPYLYYPSLLPASNNKDDSIFHSPAQIYPKEKPYINRSYTSFSQANDHSVDVLTSEPSFVKQKAFCCKETQTQIPQRFAPRRFSNASEYNKRRNYFQSYRNQNHNNRASSTSTSRSACDSSYTPFLGSQRSFQKTNTSNSNSYRSSSRQNKRNRKVDKMLQTSDPIRCDSHRRNSYDTMDTVKHEQPLKIKFSVFRDSNTQTCMDSPRPTRQESCIRKELYSKNYSLQSSFPIPPLQYHNNFTRRYSVKEDLAVDVVSEALFRNNENFLAIQLNTESPHIFRRRKPKNPLSCCM